MITPKFIKLIEVTPGKWKCQYGHLYTRWLYNEGETYHIVTETYKALLEKVIKIFPTFPKEKIEINEFN